MPAAEAPRYVGSISRKDFDRAARDPYVQAMIRRAIAKLGWEPHVYNCRAPCREYSRFRGLSANQGQELWDAIKEPDRFPEFKSYRKVAQIAYELEWKWGRTQPRKTLAFGSVSTVDLIRTEAALVAATWYVSRQQIPWWRRRKRSQRQRIHKEMVSLIKSSQVPAP